MPKVLLYLYTGVIMLEWRLLELQRVTGDEMRLAQWSPDSLLTFSSSCNHIWVLDGWRFSCCVYALSACHMHSAGYRAGHSLLSSMKTIK